MRVCVCVIRDVHAKGGESGCVGDEGSWQEKQLGLGLQWYTGVGGGPGVWAGGDATGGGSAAGLTAALARGR